MYGRCCVRTERRWRMSMMSDYLSVLVKRVKATGKFDDIRFIKGLGAHSAEKPVTGFIAACTLKEQTAEPYFLGTGKKNGTSGVKFSQTAKIQLYAPFDASGKDLWDKVCALGSALFAADKQGAVGEMKVSEPAYSKDSDAMFSVVSLKLERFVSEVVCDE